MLNLNTRLDIKQQSIVREYTRTRFKDNCGLRCPEALSIYEESFLDEPTLKELCEEDYGHELYEPMTTYIPNNVIRAFDGTGCVPVQYMSMNRSVTGVYLDDLEHVTPELVGHTIELLPTTPYFYFRYYNKYFGTHDCLLQLPVKQIFGAIVDEAVTLKAADITISTIGKAAEVYYNVRKKKVYSHRLFTSDDIKDLIDYLFSATPFQDDSRMPQAVGVDLNKDYRGRVMAAPKYRGYMITIRVLPKSAFDYELEDLNLTKQTISFIRNQFLDGKTGLHLIVGATMSGKNTTASAILKELVAPRNSKVISVEMPVEQELIGVEQVSCESIDEYRAHCEALVRENPDYVYITEMNDAVGSAVIRTANTGKCVISTLHANGVADTLTRLQDITGWPIDRLLFILHSVIYQELRRDDEHDRVYPYNRCLRFTDDVKQKLFGKSLGEIVAVINSLEVKDD